MKIKFDIHTHSEYSRFGHGKGAVTACAMSAKKKGILLGIADHGPGHIAFGIRANKLKIQRADIDEVNAAQNMRVLQGVEANLMDFDGRNDIDALKGELDYALLGYHRGVSAPKFASAFFSKNLMKKDNSKSMMTSAIINAMRDVRIDAITHPGEYVPVDMAELAIAAAHYGVALELNAHHVMAFDQARSALENGAHFLLSSDSHEPKNIGLVDAAIRVARLARIPNSRIINLEYDFDAGLRLDRLCQWSCM